MSSLDILVVGTGMAPIEPGAGGLEGVAYGWAKDWALEHRVTVASIPSRQRGCIKLPLHFHRYTDDLQLASLIRRPWDLVVIHNRPACAIDERCRVVFHNQYPAWATNGSSFEAASTAIGQATEAGATFYAVSDFLRSDVSEKFSVNVTTTRPFVDNAFLVTGRERASKDFVVRYSGRLLWKKGIGRVIELARKLPEIPFEITDFISPWTASTAEHREIRHAIGQYPNIALIQPPPTRHELAHLVATASVALVPSFWPEPFGLAALEAQAASTHLLASGSGGLREAMAPGVSPVDFDDIPTIASTIENRLSSPIPDPSIHSWIGQHFSRKTSASVALSRLLLVN